MGQRRGQGLSLAPVFLPWDFASGFPLLPSASFFLSTANKLASSTRRPAVLGDGPRHTLTDHTPGAEQARAAHGEVWVASTPDAACPGRRPGAARLTLTADLLPTGEEWPLGCSTLGRGASRVTRRGVCSPGRGSPGVGAQWGHGTRVLPLLRQSGPEQAPCSWLPGHSGSPGPLIVRPRRRPTFHLPLL